MGLICIIFLVFIIVKGRKKWGLVRQILILVLLFVINLRPMIVSPDAQILSSNYDVLFVVDNTLSMRAEDYNGKERRIDAVKADCKYIMEELDGSRFSVISFNNDSQVLVPYTRDTNLAYESIEVIRTIDTLYARGSTLNVAKDAIKESLESASNESNRKKIIFFISDGEITNGEKLKSFSEIKKYVDDGAVLGYGTKKGGKILVKDTFEEEYYYLQDKSGYPYVDAVSVIDEDNLKDIAKDIGIDYINMNKQSNITSKINELKKGKVSDISPENISSFTDIYYFFVIPLIVLLMFEFFYYKRKL
ncbi:MAG: VWA domain-containing protein [Clostridia bacterium]|nr:VWA domain-containing protein [Clostridia bacterium]